VHPGSRAIVATPKAASSEEQDNADVAAHLSSPTSPATLTFLIPNMDAADIQS
jgi:hypothetical protein